MLVQSEWKLLLVLSLWRVSWQNVSGHELGIRSDPELPPREYIPMEQ